MNASLEHVIHRLFGTLLWRSCSLPLDVHMPQAELSYQDGATTPPVLTHVVQPEYTQAARRARFQGFCIVHLTVDERGIPQNVHVTQSIGMGLDGSAIKAVQE